MTGSAHTIGNGRLWILALLCATFCPAFSSQAEMRSLPDHVRAAVAGLQPVERVPSTNRLRLAISLPLHHQAALEQFLHRLYDPTSPDYHHYLTPQQFRDQFGPTEEEYQSVIRFAKSNALEVPGSRNSRMILDLQGQAADVEKAFHVKLHNYQHPSERRQFYAPDVEPTIDSSLPILDVAGLNNYATMRPASHRKLAEAALVTASGTGPGGNFMGKDFRNAYLPGASLNGMGQMVGLLEFDGYYTNDIANYEAAAALPNVPLINVPLDDFGGPPGSGVAEVSLDIEMAVSMAPGLAGVVVFEAPNDSGETGWMDMLDSMSCSNQILQFSSSWGYASGDGPDPNTAADAELQKMAAQGQSFFQASGDGDAWVSPIWVPGDSPYLTSVGGTLLAMNGAGASYNSETVWNSGYLGVNEVWEPNGNGYWGSGGGISTVYSIPTWQQGVRMADNNGSTNMRNVPDIAFPSDDIWVIYNNGEAGSFFGTSCAAPLWAGFVALANQQAAANGDTNVGFINPALYSFGQTNNNGCFHDIISGNDTNAQSDGLFSAAPGYDLCTGWGTPVGSNLINALAPLNALQILPAAYSAATGGIGGPFTWTCQTYILTNSGSSTLNWSLGSTAPWLTASPTSGELTPGGPAAAVTLSLTATASNDAVGIYDGSICFTNLANASIQSRPVTLNVIAPPSFTQLPTNQIDLTGSTVILTATATGGAPLSYQWQQNGSNLANGSSISGAFTPTLTVSNAPLTATGSYTIIVANAAGAITSTPPALLTVLPSLQLVQNSGFETGNFSSWTLSGNAPGNLFVSTGAQWAHAGVYGVKAGPAGGLGYLSQTLPTVPGQVYLVSAWFDSPSSGAFPNEFSVSWNGTNLFDEVDVPDLGWTNLQFEVAATATNTVLQFGFDDDPAYLGLDQVSVLPMRPTLQNTAVTGGTLTFTWRVLSGFAYQIQTTTNLAPPSWTAVGSPVIASNFLMTSSNVVGTNAGQYYRVSLAP